MNDITKALLAGLAGLMLVCMGASGVGLAWYTWPAPPPEVVEVERVLFKDRIETIIVPEVIIVYATPEPPAPAAPIVELPAPTPTATPAPVQIACTNVAWVVSQPISDAQGSAMKAGTIKRLRFVLRNEGSCTWSDYVLTSGGVFPDLPIPYTPPGEIAEIVYDFQAWRSLEARFVLQPPTMSGLFGVMNSASPGVGEESIYYRMDVYAGTTTIQIPDELGGGMLKCDGIT